MENKLGIKHNTVLFIPHGGGPLPLLGDDGHYEMVSFLENITPTLATPTAIIVISAHWEEQKVTITSGKTPALIYDYSGFPDESYKIKYPAPGNPDLAEEIYTILQENEIEATLDEQRGFDHGLFVPLKIMFPDADIPCVQISLLSSLNPESHIRIGQALSGLRKENLLILGSGFSFHNLSAFFRQAKGVTDERNEAFQNWLVDICTDGDIPDDEREKELTAWDNAPFARYCHPREEHLLPLHVCYGVTSSTAELVFDGKVIGKRVSAFLWDN